MIRIKLPTFRDRICSIGYGYMVQPDLSISKFSGPKSSDLSAIASKKINLLLQEFRQGLIELYGDRLAGLILYGSYARQEATAESDIDVMVVLYGSVSPGDEIFRMGDVKTVLNLKYDELLSVVPISMDDYQHRSSPLLEAVRQEGIAV